MTDIDVQVTLDKNLGVAFRPYLIIGACNPAMAFKALQAEDQNGTMLPCNVMLQQKENEGVEVSAVDPVASMQAIYNSELANIAGEVQGQLREVISDIAGRSRTGA